MLPFCATTNIEVFWNEALQMTFASTVDYPCLLHIDIRAVMFFFIDLFTMRKLVLLLMFHFITVQVWRQICYDRNDRQRFTERRIQNLTQYSEMFPNFSNKPEWPSSSQISDLKILLQIVFPVKKRHQHQHCWTFISNKIFNGLI